VAAAVSSVDEFIAFLRRVADKWSTRYEVDRVFEADPAEGVPKYFTTAAYMYPSGPIHVGHGRTYLIADVIARFKRLLGYNVLFPMGFHYTGTPVLVRAEAISEGRVKELESMSTAFNVDLETLRKLGEPVAFARYFHELSKEAMKLYGLSIDWRREFTTIDPEYKSFIRWQFTKLLKLGLLVKGTHPVGWCPRHGMPVGMHDTEGDVEPEVGELTLIKFRDGEGRVYPVATLRPETVFGVTNVWVNPEAEYCLTEVGGETWVISCIAAEKFSYQLRRSSVLRRIPGRELVGLRLVNPATNEEVPVLSASFVNPKFGSGVVMSVPAHAPYDYVALRDYVTEELGGAWPQELLPRPLIAVPGYGEVPAKDVIELLGVRSQSDVGLLEEATKRVYRDEFERGVIREDAVKYLARQPRSTVEFFTKHVAGKSVKEARESSKELLRSLGAYDSMYEVINSPVYCRCGTEVVVKVLEEQWFIDYGNPKWKELAREALRSMEVVPEEAKNGIEATIDWLRERACARTRGLGTELPWASGWVIEALSDSTIYMAFYTVIHRIRSLRIPAEKLGEEFWDYVFLGLGSASELAEKLGIRVKELEAIRREFLYWYPLDSRHSGKDLIPNHLTFFIFNHVAVFPRELWPRRIVANGWVLLEGARMSKSKGNVKLLKNLVEAYSPDALRLGLVLGAEVDQDLDLREDVVISAARQLARVYETVRRVWAESEDVDMGKADEWLRGTLRQHVASYVDEMERVKLRSVAIRVFFKMLEDLETYLKWAGRVGRAARDYIATWVKMMSPFTPFLAEELWESLGYGGYVAKSALPRELYEQRDVEFDVEQRYLELVLNDVRSVLEVTEGDVVVLYTASRELTELVKRVAEMVSLGGELKDVVKALYEEATRAGIGDVFRALKLVHEAVNYITPAAVLKYIENKGYLDEYEILTKYRGLLAVKLGVREVRVYSASDPGAPDYGGRKRRALPLRPGIYLTSSLS